MTFRVNHQSSDNPARCPYRVVVQATGREIDCINQYLDYETVRRLANHTLQSYANELLFFLRWWDGRVFIALTRSPKMPSRNRHCSTMCDSCLVNSPRCPAQPLTPALPLSIKPYAICSLMLLIRLLRDFKGPIGNVRQWALADHDLP